MKKQLTFAICILLTMQTFAQKTSWITYFPAQDNIIGQMCTGTNPQNYAFSRFPGMTVETEKYKSFDVLDQQQKKSLLLKFGEVFSLDKVNVTDIYAKNIYCDRIKAELLATVSPGVQFVYSGLRADSVSIVITKEVNVDAKPQEIAEKIKSAFPQLQTYEIEKLLPSDINTKNKKEFTVTISDPNVYFMIQVATIELDPMYSIIGNEYVGAFGQLDDDGNCNKKVKRFTLTSTLNQTCFTTVKIPSGAGGSEIKCVLEYRDNKLFLNHKSANLKEDISTELQTSVDKKWLNQTGKFIYRYPFDTDKDEFKFKEVYLFINADKTDHGVLIRNRASRRNFPTRIAYPNSNLVIRSF